MFIHDFRIQLCDECREADDDLRAALDEIVHEGEERWMETLLLDDAQEKLLGMLNG
jgi:hypothetical protein